MDSLHVPVGADETTASARPRRTVKCDSCGGDGAFGNGRRCEVCDGAGRVDEHRFELVTGDDSEPADVLDRWQAALDRRRESGSYVELDEALAGLIHHVNKPVEWRWVTEFAVRAIVLLDELWLHRVRELEELRVQELALVEAAEAYIDWRMPAMIRVPKEVRENEKKRAEQRKRIKGRHLNGGGGPAVERFRGEICKLIRSGKPTQWVAAEYGLSVRRVNQIVAGVSDDEAA